MTVLALVLPMTASAAVWVKDAALCPTAYQSQDCGANTYACSYSSSTLYCDTEANIEAAIPSSDGTTSTYNPSSGLGGGFVFDCVANSGATCSTMGTTGWKCQRDSSCYNVHRQTICDANATTFSCSATCIANYQECDGSTTDGDGCEIYINGDSSTAWGRPNVIWEADCTAGCKSTHLDCDGNGEGDSGSDGDNGCEWQKSASCTTGGGLPGTQSTTCPAICLPNKSYFETGTESGYSTTDPLLWGTQYGTGDLINIEKDSGNSFVVDNSANVTTAGVVNSGGLTVDTMTLHVDTINHRVGIGLLAPSTELEVDGEIQAVGITVPNTFYIDGDAGTVEIGTTTQTSSLDVYGTVTATEFVGDGSGLTGLVSSLDSLSDTTITSNSAGEILKWSGTAWINNTLTELNTYLGDLADGSLSGSAVGSGISGTNISTGTVADARIASTITRDSEWDTQGEVETIWGVTLATDTELSALETGAVATNTTNIITNATNIDTLTTDKADIASPTFTGDPTAPTPTTGDNDTSIATTAFVTGALAGISSDAVTDTDSDTKIQVEESADEDKIRFDTAGSERMIIDASGKVGIGTSAPSYKLSVQEKRSGVIDLDEDATISSSTRFDDNSTYGVGIKNVISIEILSGTGSEYIANRADAIGSEAAAKVTSIINYDAHDRIWEDTAKNTLENHIGYRVSPLNIGSSGEKVTNNYGVYIDTGDNADNNYGIYQVGQKVLNHFEGEVEIDAKLTLNDRFLVNRTASSVGGSIGNETIYGITDTSVARTITLSTVETVEGRIVIVKDESGGAGTNNITVDTLASQTIDGASSIDITADYGVLRLYSDGTNWFSF